MEVFSNTTVGDTCETSCGKSTDFALLTAHFRANMKKAVVELLGPDLGSKVKIELGKDGSGVGAGVIAALA